MSATNKTTYYELPVFIGTDTPSWLGDWNNAMNTIDTAINGVHTEAQSAANAANSASSKSDANTQSITAMQTEIQTIKTAVQNYDSILNFAQVPTVFVPNNSYKTGGKFLLLIMNTNKTLGKFCMNAVVETGASPVTYVAFGSLTWFDLVTIEDNIFKLNQTSLPKQSECLSLGLITGFNSDYQSAVGNRPLYAWFDGVTTHLGIVVTGTLSTALPNHSTWVCNLPIMLTGSVYVPPTE